MENEELTQYEPTPKPFQSVPGVAFVVGVIFFLFVIIEIDFLADLHTLLNSRAQWGYFMTASGFQMSLLVSLVCFWRLWRKKTIVQVGQSKQNFFTLYLSVGFLSLLYSLLLFRDIGLAVYQAAHSVAH